VVTIKKPQEIKTLKEGGKRLARVMSELSKEIKPGISGDKLDKLTHSLMLNYGGKPSFLHYKPDFTDNIFPSSLCISKNEVVVHGIPQKGLILDEGDIVTLDLGMIYKELYTDMAATFGVGKISPELKQMIKTTKDALVQAIKVAIDGMTIGDIGYAIESCVKKAGFVVVRDLIGHGVGYGVHEDPEIFNYGTPNTGLKLKTGMVLAIEPMVTFKRGDIIQRRDGSFATKNGMPAVHFEHTVVVMPKKAIILTKY